MVTIEFEKVREKLRTPQNIARMIPLFIDKKELPIIVFIHNS